MYLLGPDAERHLKVGFVAFTGKCGKTKGKNTLIGWDFNIN